MDVTPSESPADPRMGMLRISLLGTPTAEWAGAPIPLLRRQTRGLLYCLAALRPVARMQLCFLFWPDVPDATVRRNLSRLVALLRQSLPQTSLLMAEDAYVRLDPQQTWCDTAAFGALTAVTGAGGPHARRAALAEAVQLVRGPFLEGFALPDCPEFEAWMERERRTWERRLYDCLGALIEAHTAAQEYPAAIAAAQHYLQIDPLAEDIHRRLITLYAAAGERTAALRQFEQCAVILERELGVSPLPETRAVYEAARAGTVPGISTAGGGTSTRAVPPVDVPPVDVPPATGQQATDQAATGQAAAARSSARPAIVQVPVPAAPLIGRRRELAEVTARLQQPDVRLLTLTGPGGAAFAAHAAGAVAAQAGGAYGWARRPAGAAAHAARHDRVELSPAGVERAAAV